jgi:hypothetical protein
MDLTSVASSFDLGVSCLAPSIEAATAQPWADQDRPLAGAASLQEVLDFVEQGGERTEFQRLYEIPISSKFVRPRAMSLEARSRQDYKGDFAEVRLKLHPLEQFKPIQPWHFYVRQNQGGQRETLPISKRTCSSQIVSGLDPVPGPMKLGLRDKGQAGALKQIELVRSIFDCQP